MGCCDLCEPLVFFEHVASQKLLEAAGAAQLTAVQVCSVESSADWRLPARCQRRPLLVCSAARRRGKPKGFHGDLVGEGDGGNAGVDGLSMPERGDVGWGNEEK